MILIGELRTNETMKLALQLASYGILVFGTVHTNSAPATIDRIVNAFPADEQAAGCAGCSPKASSGIVAQQLLRHSRPTESDAWRRTRFSSVRRPSRP